MYAFTFRNYCQCATDSCVNGKQNYCGTIGFVCFPEIQLFAGTQLAQSRSSRLQRQWSVYKHAQAFTCINLPIRLSGSYTACYAALPLVGRVTHCITFDVYLSVRPSIWRLSHVLL